MFLERIAVFTLQVRAKLLGFFNFLLRETDSQIGQIFFVCCLFFLTGLLFYVWAIPSTMGLKISFSVIYILSFLLCVSAIHFIIKRKRIRNKSNKMEVYTLYSPEQSKFLYLNLKSIPLTESQADAVFKAFSWRYLNGTFQSFQSLIKLKPITNKERMEWKDPSPKSPKQVNRQSLLEFLSNLLEGFENLENYQIIELVEDYFILKNSAGTEQTLSSKNISDWRTNQATYLKEVSRIFQQNLKGNYQ